jgi:hypothetical protein
LALYGTNTVEFAIDDTWTYSLVILELVLINTTTNFLLKTRCRNSSSDLVSMISFFNTYNGFGSKIRNIVFWVTVVLYVMGFIFACKIEKLDIPSEMVRFAIDVISAIFVSNLNKTQVANSTARKAEIDRKVSAMAMAINTPAPKNNSEN